MRTLGILFAALLLIGASASFGAATITVVNNDDPGEGFNDTTAADPVTGNPGTTLGQQRLNVFQAAADAWGEILETDIPIAVLSQIDPLPCDTTSAVLGGAGPFSVFSFEDNAQKPDEALADTWYHAALANALAGQDLDATNPEIFARFNGDIDTDPNCVSGFTWWYGIGAPAPSGTLDFFRVVLHEIGHGIGFSTFVDSTNGQRFFDTNDIFMTNLRDQSLGLNWDAMSDAQRMTSAIDTDDLLWTGANAVGAGGQLSNGRHPSGGIEMYAPNPVEVGSSVSHWSTDLTPNELMEPFLTNDGETFLTVELLEDIGWPLADGGGGGGGGGGPGCTPDNNTLCLNNDRFQVQVTWTDFDNNSGPGVVVPFGSDDSGLFWFFNADNWEMLIKVLNGCPINDHFWVFAAATTNVEYTLTVTDTQTGDIVTYDNPLGVSSPAVTDNRAFATCP